MYGINSSIITICLLASLLIGCTDEALKDAVVKDDLNEVRRLLANGSDANANLGRGNRPLHFACSASVATELINQGADVNRRTSYGNTPLHAAASHGRVDVANVLIQSGADINAQNEHKYTPLHWAVADMEDESAWSEPFCMDNPIQYIGVGDKLKVAYLLITNGADVNAQTDMNETPLHRAASSWETADAVEMLIKNGATVNSRDWGNYTPLWHAESSGQQLNVTALKQAGGVK